MSSQFFDKLLYIFLIYFRHRAINIFARTYYELWLQDENVGQEVMIEDLTVRIRNIKLNILSYKYFVSYFPFHLSLNIF